MSRGRTQLDDRIAGALVGVTVGDTLGAPLEFKSPGAIRQRWGVHRDIEGVGTFGHRPGEGTDDSDLTFAVSRAYRSGPSVGEDDGLLERVADNFIAWRASGPRDIGGATAGGIGRLRELRELPGARLTSAGGTSDGSCGNGSLMRTVAVGLVERDREQVGRRAREISALTHAHPRCTEACAAYSTLVSRLVEGEEPRSARESTRKEIWSRRFFASSPASGPAVAEVAEAFDRGWDVAELHAGERSGGIEELDTSGYVLAGLALSTWALRRSLDVGPEEALIEVVNRGGDADTNGAIVGGLLGAAYGLGAWPDRWVERVEYRDEAVETAADLAGLRGARGPRASAAGGRSLDVDDLVDSGSVVPQRTSGRAGADASERGRRNGILGRLFAGREQRRRARGGLCGHWMPIARTRCVLPAGHPPSVHHSSVGR